MKIFSQTEEGKQIAKIRRFILNIDSRTQNVLYGNVFDVDESGK